MIKEDIHENKFSPLHEKNSRILAIILWEEKKKDELSDRDWKNWENLKILKLRESSLDIHIY
jgi:hypothetical protein